ncbi:hypothetical protein GLX27_004093 [Malassezia furfur]|uniref:Erythromycin biosynthesis protein CIII-like C-terminal domain-containing protein n=1 Tax=Malassezia furfur TaxID=55194 RepID=A0ABY8F0L8_MALFU|nr:hypothetical protein CBS14141_004251 [Malassezia furfur]WFD49413.1 hypothetical protein GLX27_004093 [Malassezia furfur]
MRRFLIITNPATGQMNPLLAVSEELINRGHQVVLASSDNVLRKVQKLQTKLGRVPQPDTRPSEEFLAKQPLVFYSLGSGEALADYTAEAAEDPERFHKYCRSAPGDIWGWLKIFTELVPPSSDDYRDLVFHIRDMIEEQSPDLVIVDNFSPFAVDGVRLTKRPFIETSPGASSAVAKDVDLWRAPMPMSGGRKFQGGLLTFLHNVMFILMWLKFVLFNPWAKERRRFREKVLGLEPTDIVCDSVMTPTPGMLKEQIATISFNVANMDFFHPSAYDNSVYFVGLCFPPSATSPLRSSVKAMQLSTPTMVVPVTPSSMSPPLSIASTPTVVDMALDKDMSTAQGIMRTDPVKAWLDQASLNGKRVVYINMGSIFFYSRRDYDNIVEALLRLHDLFPELQVLWKIPKLPFESQPIPSADESRLPLFIRREEWLPSVEDVLQHPAVAVCVHHGGGNSFNEALYYGIPQFCVSQWVDTHDIGAYIEHSGVGLWAEKSPFFDPIDVSTKLAQLLEDKGDKFRHAALAWKLRAMQAGGTTAAANIIESYLSNFHFPQGSKMPLTA